MLVITADAQIKPTNLRGVKTYKDNSYMISTKRNVKVCQIAKNRFLFYFVDNHHNMFLVDIVCRGKSSLDQFLNWWDFETRKNIIKVKSIWMYQKKKQEASRSNTLVWIIFHPLTHLDRSVLHFFYKRNCNETTEIWV